MVENFSIYISAFEEARNIRVYLPYDYQKNEKRYPVLYMHDGQNVFRDNDAIGGISLELEKYLNEKELNVIVVAIDQNIEERKNEYCPWINGVFKNIVIMSAAFYANQEEIEKLLRYTDLSEVKSFYLDCGTKEAGDGTVISEEFINSNKEIYEILKEKLPNIEFKLIDGGEHNYRFFRKRITELFNHLN
jgi:predicted alpha/beta superfamily hydrolase